LSAEIKDSTVASRDIADRSRHPDSGRGAGTR
jgi:hypothetical protein